MERLLDYYAPDEYFNDGTKVYHFKFDKLNRHIEVRFNSNEDDIVLYLKKISNGNIITEIRKPFVDDIEVILQEMIKELNK